MQTHSHITQEPKGVEITAWLQGTGVTGEIFQMLRRGSFLFHDKDGSEFRAYVSTDGGNDGSLFFVSSSMTLKLSLDFNREEKNRSVIPFGDDKVVLSPQVAEHLLELSTNTPEGIFLKTHQSLLAEAAFNPQPIAIRGNYDDVYRESILATNVYRVSGYLTTQSNETVFLDLISFSDFAQGLRFEIQGISSEGSLPDTDREIAAYSFVLGDFAESIQRSDFRVMSAFIIPTADRAVAEAVFNRVLYFYQQEYHQNTPLFLHRLVTFVQSEAKRFSEMS